MQRRECLATTATTAAAAAPQAVAPQEKAAVKLGIDLFSIRSSGYTPL